MYDFQTYLFCRQTRKVENHWIVLQLSPCKNEHEGSVIAEVGSEHYDSDGHDALIMDPDQNKTPSQKKDQIEVLKGTL